MKAAIFMMGSPAAGKSTIAKKLFGSSYLLLDSDKIKESHQEYDPKHPELLHDWSSSEMEKQFQATLQTGRSFVLDGTGSNPAKMIRRMLQSTGNGYKTYLIYVSCTLQESLLRNAARDRNVPEEVVREIYSSVVENFNKVSLAADSVLEIIN